MPAGAPDGHDYSKEQIIQALGEPDNEDNVIYHYFSYYSEVLSHEEPSDDSSLGRGEKRTRILEDEFGLSDLSPSSDWKFSVFMLESDRFAVNGYVRVGDHVSKVRDMVRTAADGSTGIRSSRPSLTAVCGTVRLSITTRTER